MGCYSTFQANFNYSIKVGDTLKVVAVFSVGVSQVKLFVNIFGRAGLVKHENISLSPDDNNQFWIPITVTKEMTPSCRVVCYYIQRSGEIIYDQLVFKVNPTSSHAVSAASTNELFELSISKSCLILFR